LVAVAELEDVVGDPDADVVAPEHPTDRGRFNS
jgi:hypothetical protein